METLEFLGGKYNGGEQILPGVIQTYRATEAATGRSVFVHCVASGDDPAQQLALYRLLAAALVRSPLVRSMVLDMRDENSDWYVVTETAPQCLLLREWLQFELGNSAKASDGKKGAAAQPVPSTPVPPPEPARASAPVPPTTPESAPPPAAPVDEPGEFTRFFTGNPPPAPPQPAGGERPSSPDLPRLSDRPTRSGMVQRPNTPMPFIPPAAPHGAEPGEFTRLFSKPGTSEAGQTSRPKSPTDYQDPSKLRSEPAVSSLPPSSQQPGEYTRIFGQGTSLTPVQQPAVLGQAAPASYDDPLLASGPVKLNDPKGPATTGPSEYTRVLGGTRLPAGHGAEPLNQSPGGPTVTPAAGPVSVAAPSLSNAMGSAHVNAPPLSMQTPNLQPALGGAKAVVSADAKNMKMIIFFAALGALALLLILLVVLALKK